MKRKTTRKAIIRMYQNIIEVNADNLFHLLFCRKAIAFTCGLYGWNADIYPINQDTVIVSGIRPFGNIKANHDLTLKYDKMAREILSARRDEKITDDIDMLLKQFIDEVIGKVMG